MNNEIKAILEFLDDNLWVKYGNTYQKSLTDKECKLLLDYITNLQEENKEWSMIFDTFSKRPLAHRYLEEKKKQLNNDNLLCLDSEMIYKDYYDYKSRIDKAVEYICDYSKSLDEKTIIDILKGEDK